MTGIVASREVVVANAGSPLPTFVVLIKLDFDGNNSDASSTLGSGQQNL